MTIEIVLRNTYEGTTLKRRAIAVDTIALFTSGALFARRGERVLKLNSAHKNILYFWIKESK